MVPFSRCVWQPNRQMGVEDGEAVGCTEGELVAVIFGLLTRLCRPQRITPAAETQARLI